MVKPIVFDETDNPHNYITEEEYDEQVKAMFKALKEHKESRKKK